ncbi:MAG: YcaO-like family protein [Candidatus Gastranaerophilales bacterium]|nr:YcaO-like family protein [Candidatus Gastranaerophilales bacterium]
MQYSIKKDDKPENTVKRIQKILKKNGIETAVVETGCEKYSLSAYVHLKNVNEKIGTNGKGSCPINALASGYAEFMERLQTNFLIPFHEEKFCSAPDEKIINIHSNNEEIVIKEFKKKGISIENAYKAIMFSKIKYNPLIFEKLGTDNLPIIPFASYKQKKIIDISLFLAQFLQGSTGLAAGNTFEEASLQGLSEIVERYCYKQVFLNKISMPNIPKEYYEQYENIIGLIKEIEKLGYKVILKDASLGKNFPTVCVIVEDLKNLKNGVTFRFGTHPYFPIALERTLTEFLQGNNQFEEFRKHAKYIHSIYSSTTKKILAEQVYKKRFFKRTNKTIEKILSDNCKYKFDKNNWLFDEDVSNKVMFNNLAKLVLKHTDDIYIRNYSFLGFPTVAIYAGEFSNPLIIDKNYFKKLKKYHQFMRFTKEEIKNNGIEELFEIFKFVIFERPLITSYFEKTEFHYFGFLCAVFLQNKKYIKKFANAIIGTLCIYSQSKITDTTLHLYQAYLKYFKLYYTNTPKEKIQEIIEKKYSKIIYLEIIKTLESLNEDKIKEKIEEEIKKIAPVLEASKDVELEKIGKKLTLMYEKNIPKQKVLLEMFDDYKISLKDKIIKKFAR